MHVLYSAIPHTPSRPRRILNGLLGFMFLVAGSTGCGIDEAETRSYIQKVTTVPKTPHVASMVDMAGMDIPPRAPLDAPFIGIEMRGEEMVTYYNLEEQGKHYTTLREKLQTEQEHVQQGVNLLFAADIPFNIVSEIVKSLYDAGVKKIFLMGMSNQAPRYEQIHELPSQEAARKLESSAPHQLLAAGAGVYMGAITFCPKATAFFEQISSAQDDIITNTALFSTELSAALDSFPCIVDKDVMFTAIPAMLGQFSSPAGVVVTLAPNAKKFNVPQTTYWFDVVLQDAFRQLDGTTAWLAPKSTDTIVDDMLKDSDSNTPEIKKEKQ